MLWNSCFLRRLRCARWWALLLVGWVCVTTSLAATLTTSNGLSVTLDDADGAIVGVAVEGRPVGLVPGAAGGLAGGLTLQVGAPLAPSAVAAFDFEVDSSAWRAARNADWDSAGAYVAWLPSGGVGDSGHLLLGDGVATGVGLALTDTYAIPYGANIRISWKAKSATTETTQILCVRLYDELGTDITNTFSAPVGWGWTTASLAHAKWGLANSEPDVWQPFAAEYAVPRGVAAIGVSLRHWTGGDHFVHIDDLQIEVAGGIQWSAPQAVSGPLTPIAGGVRQVAEPAGLDLRLTSDLVEAGEALGLALQAEDLSGAGLDRPLVLSWTLPIAADVWWDDIDTPRSIEPNAVLAYTYQLASHSVSLYPFSAVTSGDAGVGLGVPMAEPTAQRCEYDANAGLRSTWELVLSPHTTKLGPGMANVSAVVYPLDAKWGFRSAAARYQRLFPDDFVKHTVREGAWMYPIPASQIPNPEDFGFAFYETRPLEQAERDLCAQLDIGIYHYIARMVWQPWGTSPEKPSYEERVDSMAAWAADAGALATWQPDGGSDDTPHLLLGDGVTPGAGMATSAPFAVSGDETLEIAWQAKSSDPNTTQILRLRVFDANANDITQAVPASSPWFYSGASDADVIPGIASTLAGVWEPFAYTYVLPPEAATVRLSLSHWNYGDHWVHVDDLVVRQAGGGPVYWQSDFNDPNGAWVTALNADWENPGPTFHRAPRQLIAQAVLQSSPQDEAGRYLIDLDPYFWHEWGSDGGWNQGWPVNLDPDLASPNMYEIYRDYWVNDRLEEADGVYFDSVVAKGGVGGWANARSDHLAVVDTPPTFSWTSGAAVQLAPQSLAEFLGTISADLHAQGKRLMLNLFAEGMRWHARDADVMGSEISVVVEDDADSRLRRTLSGHRIVSNLLQFGWGDVDYATYDQMEMFFRSHLFWGFYPALSSAGGPLDGATPDRYFLHPELYERDRDLFVTYMPVIRALSSAGWEPITGATLGDAVLGEAAAERFGDFERGEVYFTLRGAAWEAVQADLQIEPAACGLSAYEVLDEAYDVLGEQALLIAAGDTFGAARVGVTLQNDEVGVYRLTSRLYGDADEDGDLDASDVGPLYFCLTGPDQVYVADHYCGFADADYDDDVDLADVSKFQAVYDAQ